MRGLQENGGEEEYKDWSLCGEEKQWVLSQDEKDPILHKGRLFSGMGIMSLAVSTLYRMSGLVELLGMYFLNLKFPYIESANDTGEQGEREEVGHATVGRGLSLDWCGRSHSSETRDRLVFCRQFQGFPPC